MALAALANPPAAAAEEQNVVALAVTLNGRDTQIIAEFVDRRDGLAASRRELRALGLEVGGGAETGMIALRSLPGVQYAIDPRRQELRITAAVDALPLKRITGLRRSYLEDVPLSQARGLVVNYDAFVTATDKDTLDGAVVLDTRAFGPWGVVTAGAIVTANRTGSFLRRLDTTYTYAEPERLRRFSAGDVISGSLPWTRAVRLGGLQLSTDFSLRPDLITFPLPTVNGQASVPSTVDVLVNGVRQLTEGVDPGPFAIQQLPVVTGAGTVTLLVKDITGQQTVQTLPFYASGALLAPGLHAISAEIGAVRKHFATSRDSYGRMAAQATLRYGLTPMMTVEAHGEATEGLAVAGAGAVFDLSHFAILSLGGALSRTDDDTGASISAAVERLTQNYRVAASMTATGDAYRDVAAMHGDTPPSLVLQASGGVTLPRIGSFGTSLTHMVRRQPAGKTEAFSALSATFSRQIFDNAYFYGTGFHRFQEGGKTGVMFGVSAQFGSAVSGGTSLTSGPSGNSADLRLSRAVRDPGETGFQFYAREGRAKRAMGEVSYRAPYALLTGGLDFQEDSTAGRVRAEGALVLVDGRLHTSNRIQDSFAVVDTGMANMRVLRENREIGRTDSRGQLLVSDLRGYEANRIALDPTDLPLDADAASTTLFIRPAARSGALARFVVRQQHSALVTLADTVGGPVPLGSTAVLSATGARMPVGYDGQVYVVGLTEEMNTLTVTTPQRKRCAASFPFRPAPGTLAEIGPLTCRPEVTP